MGTVKGAGRRRRPPRDKADVHGGFRHADGLDRPAERRYRRVRVFMLR